MNYKRVYGDFIKSRREIEKSLTCYTERHHILPRCMGGGNEPENLIRLTAEDHYFAHLCLAQIYGGKLWFALRAMANLNVSGGRDCIRHRPQYGYLKRKFALAHDVRPTGKDHHNHDGKIYKLRHVDGREASGTQVELRKITGVKNISRLVSGSRRISKDWFSPKHNPKGLSSRELRNETLKVQNATTLYRADGTTWSGSSVEFESEFGKRIEFHEPYHHCRGWYQTLDFALAAKFKQDDIARRAVEMAERKKVGRRSRRGPNCPNFDPTEYTMICVKTGRKFTGNSIEIKESLNIGNSCFCNLKNGKRKVAKGFKLLSAKAA